MFLRFKSSRCEIRKASINLGGFSYKQNLNSSRIVPRIKVCVDAFSSLELVFPVSFRAKSFS